MLTRDSFGLSFVMAIAIFGALAGCSGAGSDPGAVSAASVSPARQMSTPARVTSPAVASSETPYQADKFVDSVGMNTHFAAGGTYQNEFSTLQADLISLGVRHIRDGWPGPSGYTSKMKALAASGMRSDIITYYGETAADIQSIPAAIAPSLESYSAINEWDCNWNSSKGGTWQSTLRTSMQTLYAAVGGAYPVNGPGMCRSQSYAALGDMRSYMDFGSLHNYMGGWSPGTTGYGGKFASCGNIGFYGSISYNIGCAEQVSGPLTFTPSIAFPNPGGASPFYAVAEPPGSKPVITTENSYATLPNNRGSVDLTTQGKYITRLFLMQLAAGIPKTYWYELIDENTPCVTAFNCEGITDKSGMAPKPAFYALKGLIATLADPGSSFATTPLSYSFSGGPTTLAHMLFQKRSGQYVLALWNETPSWNVNNGNGAPIAVAPKSVTVNLPSAPNGLTVKAFDNAGNLGLVMPTVVGGAVTFSVDDHVTLMSFVP